MIKTALLIITMAGHGTVYENQYTSMSACHSDRRAVLEQVRNDTVDVLCVPHVDNSAEIFRLFDKFIDRLPESHIENGKCGGSQNGDKFIWNENLSTTPKSLCNHE